MLIGNIEVRLGSLTHLAVGAGRARGADAAVVSAWCTILVVVESGRGSARVRGVEVLVVLGRAIVDFDAVVAPKVRRIESVEVVGNSPFLFLGILSGERSRYMVEVLEEKEVEKTLGLSLLLLGTFSELGFVIGLLEVLFSHL